MPTVPTIQCRQCRHSADTFYRCRHCLNYWQIRQVSESVPTVPTLFPSFHGKKRPRRAGHHGAFVFFVIVMYRFPFVRPLSTSMPTARRFGAMRRKSLPNLLAVYGHPCFSCGSSPLFVRIEFSALSRSLGRPRHSGAVKLSVNSRISIAGDVSSATSCAAARLPS